MEDDATILAQKNIQNVSSTALALRTAPYKRPTRDIAANKFGNSQSGSSKAFSQPFQITSVKSAANSSTASPNRWKKGLGSARKFSQATEYSWRVTASSLPATGLPCEASFLRQPSHVVPIDSPQST